jgi:glycosyltransferase involved in cell wall biosynthesis
MTPLLSIVIPTRNREIYCIEAIKHILSFTENDFELIIQDNSDTTKIKDYISNIKDERLLYNYTKERLNSLLNMDFAISLAKGKFVIMIGDDDTVLPTIFNVVGYADKFNYDAISQKNIISYSWPNALGEGSSGELFFKEFSLEKKKADIDHNINKLLRNGMIDYLSLSLPKVYHGIVTKELLDKIKMSTGHYFGGLSPDIFSSISLSFLVQNFIEIDYPFSIAGACGSSTTAQNLVGTHRGELKTAPHLYLRGNYIWDKRIPSFYSVETIWAESAIKSFVELKKEHLLKDFKYAYFILFALRRGKGIRKLILRETINTRDSLFQKTLLTINVLFAFIPFIFEKISKLINKKDDNTNRVTGVENIKLAANSVMEFIPKDFPFNN